MSLDVRLFDAVAEEVDGSPAGFEALDWVFGIVIGETALLVLLHLTEDDGHALGATSV